MRISDWSSDVCSADLRTHDPGMYPKRLILDDARQLGITVLGLDVNRSGKEYTVEPVSTGSSFVAAGPPGLTRTGVDHGIRLALAEVKGINAGEVQRLLAARAAGEESLSQSLSDFWHRTTASRPVVARLVLAGRFAVVYRTGTPKSVRRRGRVPPHPHPP